MTLGRASLIAETAVDLGKMIVVGDVERWVSLKLGLNAGVTRVVVGCSCLLIDEGVEGRRR